MFNINGLYTNLVAGVQQFLGANPAGGRANGTQVTDAWLNDVQGELLNILAGAGIVPAADTPTQVLASLALLFGVTVIIRSNYYIISRQCPSTPSGMLYRIGGTAMLPASGTPTSQVTVNLPITLNGVLPGSVSANCFGAANSTEGANVAAQCKDVSTSQIVIAADTLSGGTTEVVDFNQTVACSYQLDGY